MGKTWVLSTPPHLLCIYKQHFMEVKVRILYINILVGEQEQKFVQNPLEPLFLNFMVSFFFLQACLREVVWLRESHSFS